MEKVQASLNQPVIGCQLVYLPETESTNDVAKRLAQGGAREGTVVVTEHQTAGRGRLGRRWEAPPASSLLLSVVLRPELRPWQAQQVTMACGLAVVDAVTTQTGLSVGLKWPNDLMLDGRKLGGMLTDIGLDGDRLDYVVVGIGLNVNLDPDELPAGLLVPATSLSRALGRPLDREMLLVTLLETLEARYLALKRGGSPRGDWASHLVTLGHRVAVSSESGVVEGVAEEVDTDGALMVRLADGRLARVVAGDVTLREGTNW